MEPTGRRSSSSFPPPSKPTDGRRRSVPSVPPRASRPPRWRRWLLRGALAGGLLGILGGVALVGGVRYVEAGLPSVADLRGHYHPPQVTRVLAKDGTLLAELFTERRTVVPIEAIPAHVKLAVLAAEDAGFYEHEGLNYMGIARAFLVNLRARRTRQGGSTITQQVVKNILLDAERTYKRKIREALLARRLEQELSKDEILELYLNHIYFGHGRYGIEEAARYTFGKSAKDVTIGEGALLAGLVAGPEVYSPRKDSKKALTRRAFVLEQMKAKGFLSPEQFEAANKEPLHLATSSEARSELAPEAVEIARRMLTELEPERSKRGGFVITTTIDPRLQEAARQAVRENLATYDKRHGAVAPFRAPVEVVTKKGRKEKARPPSEKPYEGTPVFEHHRVLLGVVTGTDDALGTVDVRVGTVQGTLRISDCDRYNPAHLPPSAFAQVGALVRVSLLAPVPEAAGGAGGNGAGTPGKVPLRLEAGPESAMVAIDVRTRGVVALVGNYEGMAGGLDRANQAKRQPGSTFKPVVYSYALHSRKFTAATTVDVKPEEFEGGYNPTNYEGWTGLEPLRLREALANSVNLVAVRVLRDVGPLNVVEWARSLGFQSTLKPDLSLALGSYEVHPVELCGAYATFAAGGTYEAPAIVTKIVGPDGAEVPLKPRPAPVRVLEEAEAYLTTSLLTSVVDHGTAVRAKVLARPVAGKTGTSNNAKDTWFSGYSTDIAATVWVGYDDGKSLGSETGASAALPAWVQFMKVAHQQKPPSEFPRPEGVVSVSVDVHSGKLPFDGDTEVMDEVFLAGTEPTETTESPLVPGLLGGDGGAAFEGAESEGERN